MDGIDEVGMAMMRALILEGRNIFYRVSIYYVDGRGEARISKIKFGSCSATLLFPFKGAI